MATNPFEMLKNLQGLQAKMGEMQEKLKSVRVTGSAGGGMVTVELNGELRVEKVTISPEAVDPADIRMLEDLVLAALSDAHGQLKEKLRDEMAQTAGLARPASRPLRHVSLGRPAVNALERLAAGLARLPGLGRKSASRIAYFLLGADSAFVQSLAEDLAALQRTIRPCSICGTWTDIDPCAICTDTSRDDSELCVVEEPRDVATIESIRDFRGRYHVLMGAISPIDGVGPGNLRIASLIERVHRGGVQEVILATNPTVEGETTALYLVKALKGTGVKVSRIAFGLPVGGDMEFADRQTLSRSFKGRTQIQG